MTVALWRRCDKPCILWGDCILCVCISSRVLKSTCCWPCPQWGCWKLLGSPLKTTEKYLSSFPCKWQIGNCMAEESFGPGSLWKYDSGPLELTSHCCATALQQLLVSFWYLMDSKSWQEILLSATRQVVLLAITAKKQRLKRSERAWSLNIFLSARLSWRWS